MKGLMKIIGMILGILGLSAKATAKKKAKVKKIDVKKKTIKKAVKKVDTELKQVKKAQEKAKKPIKRKKIKDAESFLKDFAKK
jgi:hypothetical protein|tara:strand:+ start:167 stop:415 length:249 start_codon:yes stop_codon:yes gene_type:complete